MKKAICFVLTFILLLSFLSSCDGDNYTSSSSSSSSSSDNNKSYASSDEESAKTEAIQSFYIYWLSWSRDKYGYLDSNGLRYKVTNIKKSTFDTFDSYTVSGKWAWYDKYDDFKYSGKFNIEMFYQYDKGNYILNEITIE